MPLNNQNMRKSTAWFLLFLLTAQWVCGRLCLEVNYLIEVQRHMTEAEQALAAELKEQAQLNASVRILEADEVTPRGNFYGDFAFSKETEENTTVYFAVEDPSKEVRYEMVAAKQSQNPGDDHPRPMTVLKSLFTDFISPVIEYPAVPDIAPSESIFHFAVTSGASYSTIPTPPPDLA